MNRQGNWATIWVVALFGLNLGSLSEVRAVEKFALVVGHNLGDEGEEPLRFAEQDAERIRAVLVDLGGIDQKNAVLLLGPNAEKLNAELSRLEATIRDQGLEDQAMIFFYFAGHGDLNDLHLAGEKLSRQGLIERLNQCKASLKIVVLDACESATSGRWRGVRIGPSFEIGVYHPERAEGMVVIRSTQEGEPAHESDWLQGAVFTHYWLSALRGAGDADGDGRVTLLEAYGFSYRNTVRHSSGSSSVVQHPSFELELEGTGELILTEPSKATARLLVPEGEDGRFLVFQQPGGAVVGEVVPSRDKTISLAVPPGKLLVQRRIGKQFSVAQVAMPFGGSYRLSEADFEEQAYETLARRGGELDLQPDKLSMGYVVRGDHFPGGWILRQGPALGYGRNISERWAFGVELDVLWSDYEETYLDHQEMSLGLSGRVGWRVPVWVTTLEFCLKPTVQLLGQTRVRSDQGRLADVGIDSKKRTVAALAFGGALAMNWWIPLGSDFDLLVNFHFVLLGMNVQEETESSLNAVPSLGGTVGLGYRF